MGGVRARYQGSAGGALTPVIADQREARDEPVFRAKPEGLVDEVWALGHEEPDEQGGTQFYDFLVLAAEKRGQEQRPGIERELRWERKTLTDFMGSFMGAERKLERQLAIVDGLILEFDPADLLRGDADLPRESETDADWQARVAKANERRSSALKHLARLSKNIWVLWSFGPVYTVDLLRWVEREMGESNAFEVRTNAIRGKGNRSLSTRHAMLDALDGINVQRKLPGDKTLGQVLELAVDWPKVVEALHLNLWPTLHLGPGTRRLSLATVQNIKEELISGRRVDEIRQDEE